MRTGVLVVGVVFLVIAAVLYLLPTPVASTTATTVDQTGAQTRTTYASAALPSQFILAGLLIGLLLTILGLVLPGPVKVVQPEPHVVESRTHIEKDRAGRRTITERREHYVQ